MSQFPETASVIFDFDGLLVDTETAEFESWNRLYSEHGSRLDLELWRDAVGYDGRVNPRAILEERTGQKLDWSVLIPRRRGYHLAMIENAPPLPGVEAALRACSKAGISVAVASNSSAQWVEEGLRRVGLSKYVQALATRDQVANAKPLPDVYLLALEKLKADPRHSIAFEDSEPGMRAAKAAGLFVVAVPSVFTELQDLSVADFTVKSLAEIDVPKLLHLRIVS